MSEDEEAPRPAQFEPESCSRCHKSEAGLQLRWCSVCGSLVCRFCRCQACFAQDYPGRIRNSRRRTLHCADCFAPERGLPCSVWLPSRLPSPSAPVSLRPYPAGGFVSRS